MCGLKRLANARNCIEHVLSDKIPGDIIETGVWRGGMSIYHARSAQGIRRDRPNSMARRLIRGLARPRCGPLSHRP